MARIFTKFIDKKQEDELVHMCFWLAANISAEFDQAVVDFVSQTPIIEAMVTA